MTRLRDLKAKWMKDPAFRAEYEALAAEFALAEEVIRARLKAKLTQAQLAKRMGTTQSAIARLEGGKTDAKLSTLRKLARATGTRLDVSLSR